MDKFRYIGNSLEGVKKLDELDIFLENTQNSLERLEKQLDGINFLIPDQKGRIKNLIREHLNPINKYVSDLRDEIPVEKGKRLSKK